MCGSEGGLGMLNPLNMTRTLGLPKWADDAASYTDPSAAWFKDQQKKEDKAAEEEAKRQEQELRTLYPAQPSPGSLLR